MITPGDHRPHSRPGAWAALVAAVVATGGCTGTLHSATGNTMSSYASQHMVPYLLGNDDVDLACQTGAAMGPFLASFERVSDRPDLPVLVSMLGAGMCVEAAAWEADLRYARAVRSGRGDEARDAQILAERLHGMAASRFGAAWQRTTQAFEFTNGCPKLEEDEEVFFLLGLSAGLQAVMHDRAARGTAGISLGIPAAAARATACLDSARWWGMPQALASAVWLTVPGTVPKDVDPLRTLEAAAAAGDAAGVRLSRAMQVVALATIDEAKVGPALAAHGRALADKPAAERWRMLDRYAAQMSRHVADKIWTREQGFRSPGDLGELPGPPEPTVPADEGVLDGLEDEPAPAEAPAAPAPPASASRPPAAGKPKGR